jgi:hypothetical protein
MKAKLKKQLRKGLIDRLKIVEYRLKPMAISKPLKDEIAEIIKSFEEIEG